MGRQRARAPLLALLCARHCAAADAAAAADFNPTAALPDLLTTAGGATVYAVAGTVTLSHPWALVLLYVDSCGLEHCWITRHD